MNLTPFPREMRGMNGGAHAKRSNLHARCNSRSLGTGSSFFPFCLPSWNSNFVFFDGGPYKENGIVWPAVHGDRSAIKWRETNSPFLSRYIVAQKREKMKGSTVAKIPSCLGVIFQTLLPPPSGEKRNEGKDNQPHTLRRCPFADM